MVLSPNLVAGCRLPDRVEAVRVLRVEHVFAADRQERARLEFLNRWVRSSRSSRSGSELRCPQSGGVNG
jgi:hypothetical protein